jgi:hypothetical protein
LATVEAGNWQLNLVIAEGRAQFALKSIPRPDKRLMTSIWPLSRRHCFHRSTSFEAPAFAGLFNFLIKIIRFYLPSARNEAMKHGDSDARLTEDYSRGLASSLWVRILLAIAVGIIMAFAWQYFWPAVPH